MFLTHREGFRMSKSTNRFRIGPVRAAFSLGFVALAVTAGVGSANAEDVGTDDSSSLFLFCFVHAMA